MKSRCKGFTLIELLIVVAIISILAAIAIPNFLEAQVRAKVARVRSDMRTISIGLESYRIDFNSYPPDRNWSTLMGMPVPASFAIGDLAFLSSPVAYLSSANLDDPFNKGFEMAAPEPSTYKYHLYQSMDNSSWGDLVGRNFRSIPLPGCVIQSHGPDHVYRGGEWVILAREDPSLMRVIYDSSNGTVSAGDLVRLVGDTNGLPVTF